MKITIDEEVRAKFPELHIFFRVIQKGRPGPTMDDAAYSDAALTDVEFADYKLFREKVSGDTLLAVERLLHRGKDDLPQPDPITNLIIGASYATRLPVTIFCDDGFGSITIRFSKRRDAMEVGGCYEKVEPGLLVADTERGILGILGIKSSDVGKLKDTSKSLVVLSFGCSAGTNKKSKELVDQASDRLFLRSSAAHR
ncbi:MAG TPA: hypothetical protein VLG16_05080 [Candidatus Saccharimonadales bacterium]|nr:hypothetical protein [Candidatus Saccharimonadales bacterium]